MTIIDAITHIDNIKPNNYSQEDKVKWLSNLDWTVKVDIIDTHEGAGGEEFSGYDTSDLSRELLVPPPHDDMYIKWLEAQIDYANGEYGKYNNSVAMFNAAYSAYANYYNRTHMPIGIKLKFF